MELSAEDVLRINVMLAGPVKAIRIDESTHDPVRALR